MQKIKYIALIPHEPYGNPQHPGSFPRCGNQSSKPIRRKSEHPSETDDRPLGQGAVFRFEFHYIAPILVLYSARPALLLCNQMECRWIFRNRRPQKYLLCMIRTFYSRGAASPRSGIASDSKTSPRLVRMCARNLLKHNGPCQAEGRGRCVP